MRKALFIVAGSLCAILAIVAALTVYAYLNLAATLERKQQRVLARLIATIGRPVQFEKIEAGAGWGLSVTIRGLKVADDPAFSRLPFIVAAHATFHIQFWPLVIGKVTVTSAELISPEIRVLRNMDGALNFATIGTSAPPKALKSVFTTFAVKSLNIRDATIYYSELDHSGVVGKVRHVDLHLTRFSAYRPFDVILKLAVLTEDQNLKIAGRIGPLMQNGELELSHAPFELRISLGRLSLEELRTVPIIGTAIPSQLFVSGPLTLSGTINGDSEQHSFTASANLSPNRVRYGLVFDKPVGTDMLLAIDGSRRESAVRIDRADLTLQDLDLKMRDVVFQKDQLTAHVDSNSFDLTALSRAVPRLSSYLFFGKAEVHAIIKLVDGDSDILGGVNLLQVGFGRRGSDTAIASGITVRVEFAHNEMSLSHTDFLLGGKHASLQARADSLIPLRAKYALSADGVSVSDLLSGQPLRETVNRLTVSGTADGSLIAPRLNLTITSMDGRVAQLRYRDLDIAAVYEARRLSARPVKVAVFGGSLSGDVNVFLDTRTQFDAALKGKDLDAGELLAWPPLEARHMLRGRLTGSLDVKGGGASWKQIRPTLKGNGHLVISNGKLAGANIVALAINSIASLPGISQLLSAAFLTKHELLLMDPDTELNRATLTFDLNGQQITTHDLALQSSYYAIRGDGSFNLDGTLDMSMDIQLTSGLPVVIPVIVEGQWPLIIVLPNLPKLTERLLVAPFSIPGQIFQKRGGLLREFLP